MNFAAEKIASDVKYSGIAVNKADIRFDFENDSDNDLIKLSAYRLQGTSFKNNVYWFGYEFEKSASSGRRADFINYLKGIGGRKISDVVLRKFLEVPMAALSGKISTYRIDAFVYPVSRRTPLVKKMIRVISEWLSRDIHDCSFELVKKAPLEIKFDWESFQRNEIDNPNYAQMERQVKEHILPAIEKLDYFSLASSVKPKYRTYITNYLEFPDAFRLEEFAKLKGKNILLVDDINTSGSTLNEILRILRRVNPDCSIYIYTLLGREGGI